MQDGLNTEVQEYFEWAAQVVKELQGTNRQLEEALRQLFKEARADTLSGAWRPLLPRPEDAYFSPFHASQAPSLVPQHRY